FTTNLHNCYDADLVKFADGSYLCAYTDNDGAWIQNRDVYYRQISPNGAPMGDHPTVLCSERYQQQYIRGAIRGNKAVFAWSDDRAGIMNSETAYTGVWGNSVISSYVAIDDPLETPSVVPEISGNYPNPFNPSTTIAFALPAGGEVSLSVFNLKGQLVRTILNEAELEAGKHTAIWDGTDSTGRIVSSGVYFCALKTAGKTVSRKMLLTK
ncbi:MAG TPA: T9SS type A sorting domain-containing protein, partial [Candidatus Cloacimonadota bacterium]|nr:T9SS type A sorting domain-containing protein [Candidatus Cloacimonadota bacterium]